MISARKFWLFLIGASSSAFIFWKLFTWSHDLVLDNITSSVGELSKFNPQNIINQSKFNKNKEYTSAITKTNDNGPQETTIFLNRKSQWKEAEYEVKNSNSSKRLPDIVGIGVEKCGSTALIRFLRHHPYIKTPPLEHLEMQYFTSNPPPPVSEYLPIFEESTEHPKIINISGATAWSQSDVELQNRYLHVHKLATGSKLPLVSDVELLMEKSPSYFNFPPFVAARYMKDIMPNSKLLLIVCDPVGRVFSDIAHEKEMNAISSDFNAKTVIPTWMRMANRSLNGDDDDKILFEIEKEISKFYSTHILFAGLYYYHLLKWLKYFPLEQIYVLDGEEFMCNPGVEIEQIQAFLKLPKLLQKTDFVQNPESGFFCVKLPWWDDMECMDETKGRTRKKNLTIEQSTRKLLSNFYRPHNEKLFTLIGRNFDWG